MVESIDRNRVRDLLGRGAQLVDVLPAKEYAAEHIPGAASIPLKALDRETVRALDPDRPVIVYCHDYQ
jgi:rhodanese-related sulfurtransferase